MRALVFRGPWDIGVERRDDPAPGPGEVAIRIAATGICGSDIHGFTGENGRRHPGQVMGHETVGTVAALGDGVSAEFGVGDVVTVNPVLGCGECAACRAGAEQSCRRRRVIGVDPSYSSAMAETLVAPAANVVALPDTMPVELGALIEPLAVGRHAAGRGHCGSDDAVLVIGGGPIGQACALAAVRLGAQRVLVSEPNGSRRALVEAVGIPAVDPAERDLAAAVEEAFGRPASLVLDSVGTSRSLADAVSCSSFGARIVLVGMNAPKVELAAYDFSTEERSLIGSFCYSAAEFRGTAAWVGTAPAELGRLIEGRVDLDGAPAAFAALARGELDASKVLVFPHGIPENGAAA